MAGRDACQELQRLCSADVDVACGRIVYTQWLNQRGTIEADVTVTRLAADCYLVVSGAAMAGRDLAWLRRQLDPEARCVVTDVTGGWAVLGLMGPRSRALLRQKTEEKPLRKRPVQFLLHDPEAMLYHHEPNSARR